MSVMDAFRLDGRVALITGGARNLGYAMAEALGEAGADLVITSRSLDSATAAAEMLRKATGRDVLAMDLDVSDHDRVMAAAQKVCEWKGHIDILVNNAGSVFSSGPTSLFERKPADMVGTIMLNVAGSLFCAKAVGKIMVEQKRGVIVNIASIAGMVGRDRKMYERTGLAQQPVDYAAAKAGVIGMTRDLAATFAPLGVRVNCISPGGFERKQPRPFIEAYSERTALGRMGLPDGMDLKGAVVYLASDASAYVTGANLVVDGGFSIWH